jgi:lipopolysaccharide/colanic/teichoic acid biosynthesis glycosyltransferase
MTDRKRLMDVAGSVALLIVLGPVFLGVALAIALTSPGPVYFRHQRVGYRGRTFQMLKFRSMRQGADKEGPYFTEYNDSRITPIGKFLRRTSLDELPQLVNVLRGDMSLVGPRPDVPSQKSLYTEDEWTLRHQVRPGITGWAQAELRDRATLEVRKALDLEYVRRCSLRLDLRIFWMTLRHLLMKGGH